MSLFTVELFITLPVYIEVEAESPDEAESKVGRNFEEYESSITEYLLDKLEEELPVVRSIEFGTTLEVEE